MQKNDDKDEIISDLSSDFNFSNSDQPEIPAQEEFYKMPTRFGTIPVDKEPLGWDKKGFEKVYPRVSLPFQAIERVSFGHSELEPNKLFFGDNLHIMRMLPSKSIDLIYIDPPFFSGRNYNVLFGDKNELRSFTDIWEGGMPGYLVWLNARLYEMKRLLKDTGSIYVHLDWHASHYVKVEMDKIFGYDHFLNEIVWAYDFGGRSKIMWPRKHDVLFWYSKSRHYTFDFSAMDRMPYKGNIHKYRGNQETKTEGKTPTDVWDLGIINTMSNERIGYPTQKPEALLERIIKASSNKGDIVADFFCGGGTTPAVAQRLDRRWIASDISRVAVSITADRLSQRAEENENAKRKIQQPLSMKESSGGIIKIPDFIIEHWGVYEIQKLGKMQPQQFRKFIIEAYNGRPNSTSESIHGYKNGEPLYVGDPEPDDRITKEEVIGFAKTILSTKGIHKGTMLAWAFSPEARLVAEKLAAREGISLDFVKLNLIPVDSPEFKSHITEKHPSYVDLVSFILPPLIRFNSQKIDGLNYGFDVSESTSMNPTGKIINVQWDFNYRGRFTSTQGFSFLRSKKSEPQLKVEYTFSSSGKKKIACRVQDDLGGEATRICDIDIE